MCKYCFKLFVQTAFQPVVLLFVEVHICPLLALSWRVVDLLGQLDESDLLEVVLSEEPAAADRRRFELSFLNWHILKNLRLTETHKTFILKHKYHTQLTPVYNW